MAGLGQNILIIDDDKRICRLLSKYLYDHHITAISAYDTSQARDLMQIGVFDAMVVDVMMPGETGIEFVKSLRGQGNMTPIIMLTALGDSDDRIAGLEVGVDDYLPKPFEPKELLLRLQAILRRASNLVKSHKLPIQSPNNAVDLDNMGSINSHIAQSITNIPQIGDWRFDPQSDLLIHFQQSDKTQSLTQMESTLLKALLAHANQVIDRQTLCNICGVENQERTMDVQINRLRKKMEQDSRQPRHIQTIRGKGYMLRGVVIHEKGGH